MTIVAEVTRFRSLESSARWKKRIYSSSLLLDARLHVNVLLAMVKRLSSELIYVLRSTDKHTALQTIGRP